MAKLFVILFWNIFVLVGCAYVVFWKDASGWWFLLAFLLMTRFEMYKAIKGCNGKPQSPPAKPR